jgi:glycosyltransferase involved in cell wall biosynthesis
MEALAAGVPVVCLDVCGQGDIVDDSCGVKIAPTSVSLVVEEGVRTLHTLATHPDHRAALGRGALVRLESLGWPIKAARMNHVYLQAIGR